MVNVALTETEGVVPASMASASVVGGEAGRSLPPSARRLPAHEGLTGLAGPSFAPCSFERSACGRCEPCGIFGRVRADPGDPRSTTPCPVAEIDFPELCHEGSRDDSG